MNTIRCHIGATVRNVRHVKGEKNGSAYSFFVADVLDDDDNKADLTIGDDLDPMSLVKGERYWFTCDVVVRRGFINVKVLAADPVQTAAA